MFALLDLRFGVGVGGVGLCQSTHFNSRHSREAVQIYEYSLGSRV